MSASVQNTIRIERYCRQLEYILIFSVSLILRLIKLILDPVMMRDSALYLEIAENWHKTGNYSTTLIDDVIVPPLPIFAIKKGIDWGLSSEIAGRSIALFLGSMIPVLGYIIALKIFKKKAFAFICVALLVLHPTLISYSIEPLRENYYLFFCGVLIIAIIRTLEEGKTYLWIVIGLLSTVLIFCRYEAMESILISLFVLLYSLINKRISLNKTFICGTLYLCSLTASFVILLSITNYDLSFILKISKYSEKAIPDVFDYYLQDNSQIGQ